MTLTIFQSGILFGTALIFFGIVLVIDETYKMRRVRALERKRKPWRR